MTPATTTTAPRAVGHFNGDFEELSALIARSWSENHEQPLRYTGDFLRSLFDYPGADFALAPSIYRDGKLAAFVAGFPRTVRIAGEQRRLLSVSFLSVAPEHKRSGYGPVLWGELLKRARKMEYDAALDFTVEGDGWSSQIVPVARVLRQTTARVFSVSFMARVLKGDEAPPEARAGQCDMPAMLCEAAARISAEVPMVRCWSRPEAEWQCRRHGALNTMMCVEERHGILNGYAICAAGPTPMPIAMLDNILWGELAPAECVALAKAFVGNAARAGARMVVTPVLNYADMQPLAAAGFRKTRRLLHAYLTPWTFPAPASLPSLYIDVF